MNFDKLSEIVLLFGPLSIDVKLGIGKAILMDLKFLWTEMTSSTFLPAKGVKNMMRVEVEVLRRNQHYVEK